ncbi:MAG: LytTR family transcriptional regulator [Bacteroidetes bacterium]|nr:LytTR family transcriptional regulator [Bacteroidota bacterium]
MALAEILQAPYPLQKSARNLLFFSIGSGIFVAAFLIFFQPFGTREFDSDSKYLFLAGYGVIVSVCMAIFTFFMPRFFPRLMQESAWTVSKHILFLWLAFSFTIFICFGYKQWYFDQAINFRGFAGFLPLALSIAIFPITALVILDYIRKLRYYQQKAQNLSPGPVQKKRTQHIRLIDEYGKEAFRAAEEEIRYLSTADNYVEIHFIREEKPAKVLLRNSLKEIEKQLAGSSLKRCHRSFMANFNHIEKVSGNAQGYQLHLRDVSQTIPLSRSRSALLESVK